MSEFDDDKIFFPKNVGSLSTEMPDVQCIRNIKLKCLESLTSLEEKCKKEGLIFNSCDYNESSEEDDDDMDMLFNEDEDSEDDKKDEEKPQQKKKNQMNNSQKQVLVQENKTSKKEKYPVKNEKNTSVGQTQSMVSSKKPEKKNEKSAESSEEEDEDDDDDDGDMDMLFNEDEDSEVDKEEEEKPQQKMENQMNNSQKQVLVQEKKTSKKEKYPVKNEKNISVGQTQSMVSSKKPEKKNEKSAESSDADENDDDMDMIFNDDEDSEDSSEEEEKPQQKKKNQMNNSQKQALVQENRDFTSPNKSAEAEFPELTKEMEEEIDDVLKSTDLVNKTTSNAKLYRKDYDTLDGLEWLNDNIITCYFDLIVMRSKKEGFPSVHAFNTFFYAKLKQENYSRAVQRWTKKIDIFSYDLNFVPLHLPTHWCLAVIDHRSKKICYYDSLGTDEDVCLKILHDYLCEEYKAKKGNPLDPNAYTTEIMKDIPQQMNGSDCGVFTIKYAEYLSRNAEITFNQQHMVYFRRRAIYELLKSHLL